MSLVVIGLLELLCGRSHFLTYLSAYKVLCHQLFASSFVLEASIAYSAYEALEAETEKSIIGNPVHNSSIKDTPSRP